MTRQPLPVLLCGLLLAVACSGDEPVTTPTSLVVPTAAATTSTSSTTSTTSSTTSTVPPSTTIDVESLKAQIAAEFEEDQRRLLEIFARPSLDGLDERLAEIAEPGSQSTIQYKARLEELVELGQGLVPNDPDLNVTMVESVELVGDPPYTEAIVTSCIVDDYRVVTLPEFSPTGTEILVGGSEVFSVGRYTEPLRLSERGWVKYTGRRDVVRFPGATTCPDA
jgi:hypothetical protein